ncbi:MAG: hypothetical protein M1499_06495 [Firmicutes bacterium]|jgi:hypothetical protein|nr:hypothetical protein [Bacillota bacterium]MCL5972193.1 hypothetical protein [Bacillota bacterium]
MWSWKWYAIGTAIVWLILALMTVWGQVTINRVGTIGMGIVTPYLLGLLIAGFILTRRSILLWGSLDLVIMSGAILIVRGSRIMLPIMVGAIVVGMIMAFLHSRTITTTQ